VTAAARSTKVVVVDVIDSSTTVLRIVGDLDALSVSEAAPALLHFKMTPPAHLHIDATEASFLDSTGLAALGMAADAVRRHGGDVTASASERVGRLIELCGLNQLIGYTPA
jgi:anti-anti-sigma factor